MNVFRNCGYGLLISGRDTTHHHVIRHNVFCDFTRSAIRISGDNQQHLIAQNVFAGSRDAAIRLHGGGLSLAGQIHSISLAQQLFGNGVECVGCMGKEPTAHLYLGYGDRRNRPARGVVLNCHGGGGPHCAFYASAYGPQGAVHSPAIGDYQFPWGAAKNIRLAKQMVQTGKPPVPYQDMIENIAVATAARRAAKLGRTVRIREVWKPKR